MQASGYEAYDRLSPAYARFLESLTAVHEAHKFREVARLQDFVSSRRQLYILTLRYVGWETPSATGLEDTPGMSATRSRQFTP